MKKRLLFAAALTGLTLSASAQQVNEKLNRAPVAVKISEGILVSWRSLTSDPKELTFDVYRNGTKVATAISDVTNWLDKEGKPGDTYKVVTSAGETPLDAIAPTIWLWAMLTATVTMSLFSSGCPTISATVGRRTDILRLASSVHTRWMVRRCGKRT